MKVLHVVGARPNFMKVAPIIREMAKNPDEFKQMLVHTGQHYDENMSQVFFQELDLPRPDVNLGVGSGSHAWQTAQVMLRFEPVVLEFKPDWVLVVGDVNSTLACALVCAKLGVKVGHVEAGLRSFDRTMPEEFNRLLTDQIADLLLTPSRDADENLLREGISRERIHFVGNVMIDSLVWYLDKARASSILDELRLEPGAYVVVTLHRPSNVDHREILVGILEALMEIQRRLPVIFPAHPRTQERLAEFGLETMVAAAPGLRLMEPLGYIDFLRLHSQARLVLTDSGGIQEETTYLGIPCLTLRANTERPVTITQGTNQLVSSRPEAILKATWEVLDGRRPAGTVPELWDGRTAERIVQYLMMVCDTPCQCKELLYETCFD